MNAPEIHIETFETNDFQESGPIENVRRMYWRYEDHKPQLAWTAFIFIDGRIKIESE